MHLGTKTSDLNSEGGLNFECFFNAGILPYYYSLLFFLHACITN